MWRMALRDRLKIARKAKIAEKFFVVRQAWRVWQGRLEEVKRERILQQYLVSKKQQSFHGNSQTGFALSCVLTVVASLSMAPKSGTATSSQTR